MAVFKNLDQLPDGVEYVVREAGADATDSEYEVSYSSNNGSYVGYSGSYAEFAPQNGVRTATVINQQKSTQIAVHKTWHGGSAPSKATATVLLRKHLAR